MKMRRKGDLPQKICAACARPFVWRKKWAKVWDEVRYCSERCKRDGRCKREGRGAPQNQAQGKSDNAAA